MTLIVGAGRVKTVTRRRIDQAAADGLATNLPITPAVAYDGTVDLWADRALTTAEEVRVTGLFVRVTDAPLRWHHLRPPVQPVCVLCDVRAVARLHDLCDGCAALFSPSEVAQ